MADDRWLMAGLGNPGARYAGNRHNAGFMVAAELAARLGARLLRGRSRALEAAGLLDGRPVIVAEPMSYMNLSGGPVAAVRRFYQIPAERLVVIHDDLDLPFGVIRLKRGGGDNGHNGLRSITAALGTPDYYRVRFGIGRPPGRMDPAEFVLHDFSAAEREQLPGLIERCADAAAVVVGQGLAVAQNQFHGPPPDSVPPAAGAGIR